MSLFNSNDYYMKKYIINVLIYLELFINSPIFPLLLSLAIFITCRTFDPVNLCDDNGWILHQLRIDLEIEISNLNNSIANKKKYYDLYLELMKISQPNYRNFSAEQNLINNIGNSREQMYESWDKIHSLEKSIKKLDSNYQVLYKPKTLSRYLPK